MAAQCLSDTRVCMPPVLYGEQGNLYNNQQSDYGFNDFIFIL